METDPVISEATPVEGPKKSNKVWIIVILVVVLFCCLCLCLAVGGGTALTMFRNGSGSSSGAVIQPDTSEVEPFFQLPNLGGVKLGEEIRVKKCGFSFKNIPDFEYTELGCFTSITAPGVGDEGPSIGLIGGPTNKVLTQEEWVNLFLESAEGIEVKQFKMTINGKDAIGFDADDTKNGVTVKSRLVSIYLGTDQAFTMVGVAPADQWDDFKPKFEAVLKSVKFFTPEPQPTETPE
jgi:hypothetical protein